jgi:hypothetical protein
VDLAADKPKKEQAAGPLLMKEMDMGLYFPFLAAKDYYPKVKKQPPVKRKRLQPHGQRSKIRP